MRTDQIDLRVIFPSKLIDSLCINVRVMNQRVKHAYKSLKIADAEYRIDRARVKQFVSLQRF